MHLGLFESHVIFFAVVCFIWKERVLRKRYTTIITIYYYFFASLLVSIFKPCRLFMHFKFDFKHYQLAQILYAVVINIITVSWNNLSLELVEGSRHFIKGQGKVLIRSNRQFISISIFPRQHTTPRHHSFYLSRQ